MIDKIIQNLQLKISYTKFILYYTFLHLMVFNAINPTKITKWFSSTDSFDYLGYISWMTIAWLMLVVIYSLFCHKYTTKAFAIITLFISTACAYFILKYNIAIEESMIMNIIHTDATESTSLLSSSMIGYFIFFAIIPSLFIANIQITYQKCQSHILQVLKTIAISLVGIVVLVYLSFASLLKAGNMSDKYALYSLVPNNYLGVSLDMIGHHYLDRFFTKDKKDLKAYINATITKNEDIIVVLAIGESARAKNMQLYGYKNNPTNPLLSKVKDLYALNGIARLGSTFYALPQIIEKHNIKLSNIALHAKLDTYCFVNFSMYDNCVQGELQAKDYNNDGGEYDGDVVYMLKDNLKTYKSGERLIMLHLGGGSHGAVYNDRIPPSWLKFKPYCSDADVLNKCTKEELINAYDNTILYTDYVLNNIINALENNKKPYVLIYLSDHGESLGENGYIFHGMPPGVALPYEQAHIPLLVKSSMPIKIKQKKQYTQPDVFDTILSLLNIQADGFDKKGNFIIKPNN